MSEDQEYHVGYGKPPKSGQFKPGQSGNPGGKKKGAKSVKIRLHDALEEEIEIQEGGKLVKVSKLEALLKRILNESMKGDAKFSSQAVQLLKGFFQGEDIPVTDATPLSEEEIDLIDKYIEFKKMNAGAKSEESPE